MNKLKYKLINLASYLPNKILTPLMKKYTDSETCDGFWFDASYARWCRHDKRRHDYSEI